MWLRQAVSAWAPGRSAAAALLAASCALASLYATGLAPDFVALPPAFACLLAALTQPGNLASRVLASHVPVFLGTVSFSTYMVHYLVKDWTKLLLVGHLPKGLVFAAYAAAVLGASVTLHRRIEEPGRQHGRMLAQRLLQRRPLPAT